MYENEYRYNKRYAQSTFSFRHIPSTWRELFQVAHGVAKHSRKYPLKSLSQKTIKTTLPATKFLAVDLFTL